MGVKEIVAGLEEEIAKLQQARALLSGGGAGVGNGRRLAAGNTGVKPRKKRVMSAEARKRIGDAQRKRWAAQKKKAAK